MSSVFDKLNLRASERRFAIVVGLIVFIAVNYVWVWPHFNDWGMERKKHAKLQAEVTKAESEVGRLKSYETTLKNLQGEGGVLKEGDLGLDLSSKVNDLAIRSGLGNNLIRQTPKNPGTQTDTNSFFEEKGWELVIQGASTNSFYNFLVNVASSDSMLRIKDMTIRPNNTMSPTSLEMTVTIGASYQKSATNKPPGVVAPGKSTANNSTTGKKP